MLRPLAVFVVLGIALFAIDRGVLRGPTRAEPIVVSGERVAELRQLSRDRTGREPGGPQLAALIQAEVDDRLLIREARRLGMDRDDPVIFRRLVQNLRFAGADPERTDNSLFEEAIALGMDRSDPVVRRRLVQRMRLLIEARALALEPAEPELRERYTRDLALHTRPARVRMKQLYFEAAHATQATQLRERLAAEGAGAAAPSAEGEPFLHPPEQPLQSERELGQRFGPDFALAVFGLEKGVWSGPLPSAYGVHLVWVHERLPEEPLPFESVREPVRYALLAERREQALARALEVLRERTRVLVATESGAAENADSDR